MTEHHIQWPLIIVAVSAALVWLMARRIVARYQRYKKRRARGFRRMRPANRRAYSSWQVQYASASTRQRMRRSA